MSHTTRRWTTLALMLSMLGTAGTARAVMTADDAVKIALQKNSQIIGADASVLDAKSGVYGAYSGILPSLNFRLSRNNFVSSGSRSPFGTGLIEQDEESHGTTPQFSANWNLFDLSSISGFRAAQSGLKAAKLAKKSTHNDVVLAVRQQYYTTAATYHIARVAIGALRVARDNERRARALFDVGSVSRSDLLKAQTQTAQSELDSLTAMQAIVNQRIALATEIGIPESELGEIDTVFTVTAQDYDEAALLEEATAARPDIQAAVEALHSAKSGRSAARFQRLPSIVASGAATYNSNSRRTTTTNPPGVPPIILPGVSSTEGEVKRVLQGTIALNWDFFDGLSTDARNASAEAQLRRSQDQLNVLQRNLESEVHQAVLAYREAAERDRVAGRAWDSALENLKLTQQKYNVGSATILDLVDAQEQATSAAVDVVSARSGMLIAEAAIERVRGHGE